MISHDEPDPILRWVADYVRRNGIPPDILEIEAALNFRQKGGLGRALQALRRVGEIQIQYNRRTLGGL